MDRLGYSQINFLFILTLIQRDDGQKKQNFGGENNRTGCLKLAWFIMPLAGVESRKRMVTGIDILIGSSWQG